MPDIKISDSEGIRDDQIQFRSSRRFKAALQKRATEQGISLTKLILLSIMASNPELREDVLLEL